MLTLECVEYWWCSFGQVRPPDALVSYVCKIEWMHVEKLVVALAAPYPHENRLSS
jgi:hypothetical protein